MTDHLCRRFRTKQAALRYNQLGGKHGRFYTDTMFASVKSIQGNTMGQIMVNDVGYTHFTPMRLKSEAPNALMEFIQDIGVPSIIHSDGAPESTQGRWKDTCRTHGIKQTSTEPNSPFQNRAEINIRELKKRTRQIMHSTRTPLRLWDMCTTYVAELRCLTAQPLYSLHGRTPFEVLTGNTPDITEYISYQWYQPVWYHDHTSFPNTIKHIGRWIGVAHNVGQALCFWVLPESDRPIARSTVQPLTNNNLRDPNVLSQLHSYDLSVRKKLGDDLATDEALSFEIGSEELQRTLQDADDDGHFIPVEPEASKPDADDFDEETYSHFTSAEVLLPKGDYQHIAKVLGRKRDESGQPIGHYHPNPILDTTIHEVQFPDGTIQEYSTNVIAEALYTQVDHEGNRWLLLDEIISHEKSQDAPTMEQLRVSNQRYTTKGLTLCCKWKDGSTSWEALKDLRASNPIEVAEYAEITCIVRQTGLQLVGSTHVKAEKTSDQEGKIPILVKDI